MYVLMSSSAGILGVSGSVYVKGDDGFYYGCGFQDDGSGNLLWNVSSTGSTSVPEGTRDFSTTMIGTAVYFTAFNGTIHQMVMAQTDTPGGYAWQDNQQMTSFPSLRYTMPAARFDNGIQMIDVDGYQIHKMMPVGGFWAEANQGFSFPVT